MFEYNDGGTAYGLGQQVIDDSRKHGIELLLSMEHAWGSYMGRAIYDDCRVSLKRPTQLLAKFEAAGKLAEQEGRFLSWTVPITNFPVVQHYTEGTTHGIYIQYGPPKGSRDSRGYYENTFKLHICYLEEATHSKRKQALGASPNAIHSLDAAHLMITTERCEFPVTTIHDSFGCLLGDMADLFVTIRETFVELYSVNPLEALMLDIGGNINDVDFGTLDIRLVLDSEYCFT
jgi:DNA-directed RNA polymerase